MKDRTPLRFAYLLFVDDGYSRSLLGVYRALAPARRALELYPGTTETPDSLRCVLVRVANDRKIYVEKHVLRS